MKLKNKKSTNESTEVTKEERIKSTIMFLIMVFFFGFLALSARSNDNNTTNNKKTENTITPGTNIDNTNSDIEGIDSLKQNNYGYIYTFTTTTSKEKITGKIYNNKEKFTIINNETTLEGARLGEDYLILENGNFHFSNVPSENIKYTNTSNLISLLNLSSFEEKKDRFEYEIEPIDMFDIYSPDFIYDEFLDYGTDHAYVYYDNKNISKIEISLNNYQKAITNNQSDTLTITLEYFDHQKQEDFDIK